MVVVVDNFSIFALAFFFFVSRPACCLPRAYQYIVRQGDPGQVFYMIVRGAVDVIEVSVDPWTGSYVCVCQCRLWCINTTSTIVLLYYCIVGFHNQTVSFYRTLKIKNAVLFSSKIRSEPRQYGDWTGWKYLS